MHDGTLAAGRAALEIAEDDEIKSSIELHRQWGQVSEWHRAVHRPCPLHGTEIHIDAERDAIVRCQIGHEPPRVPTDLQHRCRRERYEAINEFIWRRSRWQHHRRS